MTYEHKTKWRHSEERKRNISNGLKGRKLSDEHKKRISESLKGKKKTEAHKAKIKKSVIAYYESQQ